MVGRNKDKGFASQPASAQPSPDKGEAAAKPEKVVAKKENQKKLCRILVDSYVGRGGIPYSRGDLIELPESKSKVLEKRKVLTIEKGNKK